MKKFFRMVMAFSLVGGMLAFSGCTDYEDDINKLDDRLTALEQTVDELQSAIDGGAVITSVTSTENGVTVTLSNGQSFTLTNGADGKDGADGADGAPGAPGADGKDGTVVEIGADGYWYIDGKKTDYPATSEGPAGKDAPTVYYVPGTEGDEEGFWVKVTEEEGKEPVREVTDITWLPEGTVTAVWNSETQTLYVYNVEGTNGEPVVITASTGMVTSVELVQSYSAGYDGYLTFTTIIEKENVFEESGWDKQTIANPIVFKKDAQKQRPAVFNVRVSPANAKLTPEMISFVDSKGRNLDDFVTVKSVEEYDGLLTRAAVNSGLWTVKVELNKYDAATFASKMYADPNKDDNGDGYIDVDNNRILYAVQVNNTTDSDAERYVTSTYDLSLGRGAYIPVADLNFTVSNADHKRHVTEINNRFDNTSKSLKEHIGTLANEHVWKQNPYNPIPSASPYYYDAQDAVATYVNTQKGDNRSSLEVFPAVQGEEITISLVNESAKSNKYTKPTNIRAMYVTLDKKGNAIESAPSEWNAWNSYVYTGLNTVVEGPEVTITVNPGAGQTIIDDYIGFRVFAVNWDGTLVDPDGKAFYVKIGNTSSDWNAVATTIVPDPSDHNNDVNNTKPNQEKSAAKAVSGLTKVSGAHHATWLDPKGSTPVFNAVFKAEDDEIYSTANLSGFPTNKNFDKVTAIYTQPTAAVTDWYLLFDNTPYTGTLTIYNADDFVLASIEVTMTKELPGMPAGFSVKTNQLDANGVYNCYLVPNTWIAPNAINGTMDMDHVFNWGKGLADQYVVSFAAAKKDASNKDVANDVAGDDNLTVAESYINNETQHATKVSYNYGDISSTLHYYYVNGLALSPDYFVTCEEFPTVFNCIYNDTYTWHWATIEEMAEEHGEPWNKQDKGNYIYEVPSTELVYGTDYAFEDPTGTTFSFDRAIAGVSTRDGLYSAFLYDPYKESLQFKEGHVISKGNGVVDEYFKVDGSMDNLTFKATQTSTETNPTADVPSTLQLTYRDMYNHKIVINLDVTVVPR